MKGTWKPRWVVEKRPPAFMGLRIPDQVQFGTVKYLWGNVPAFDAIQLAQNEGVDFQNSINLLFAASGDLRNVVLSVANLPQSYKSPLNIVINDYEIDIVARNLIFLLIVLVEEDPSIAAEAMLHVWYSALVTESCYTLLQKKVKPIVEDVCNKIAGNPRQKLFSKTWDFGSSSLRLVLTREAWMKLPSYFDVPSGMTKETAQGTRQAVVNAPSRVDYVDRAVLVRSPAMGLGMIKYRNDGILVPFGQAREAFVIPNPTIFKSSNEWPMMDSADPTDGWSIKTFLATKAGPAKKDTYGQLHHYLKRLFLSFHHYLHSKPVFFELHHVNAEVLDTTLIGREFDRIEVSNICDSNYLGISRTLKTFGPLLRSSSANLHATLITAFLNAVSEMKAIFRIMNPFVEAIATRVDTETALKYIGSDLTAPAGTFAEMAERIKTDVIKVSCAISQVGDMDEYFNLYMDRYNFAHACSSAGVKMKEKHTIIPPWPLRVDGGLHPTQKDREDFKLLLGTGHVGHERYVEWTVGAVRAVADTQLEEGAFDALLIGGATL
ncbi:hypothetical protein EKO27_g8646 [Xylaria grammica]|uniref:DUF4470 domain-containing protein n=1 Tax=Xylaria grammica TaxID=363999 RepID=A0A439CWA1_9PEZI|nr:hypothetical protein EKO27_g8646 [Xylaria grammica]